MLETTRNAGTTKAIAINSVIIPKADARPRSNALNASM
jgi:hypothetical protein